MTHRSLLLILALVLISVAPIRATCPGHCGYGGCDDWYYPSLADIQQYHWYGEVNFFLNDYGERPFWGPDAYVYGLPAVNTAYYAPALNQSTGESASNWLSEGDKDFLAGSFDKAATAYANAMKLNPFLPAGWFKMGNALYALGRYQDAINAYDAVLKLDPQNKEALAAKNSALLAFNLTNKASNILESLKAPATPASA
jgi:tetratricopeptide (TPR) repeat protein